MMQTIMAECADDQELRAIMAAGLAATLGSIRNARALQQGSLPHPLAAAELQPLPGSNSMQRWKPICEQALGKSQRKRQSAHISSATLDLVESPAAPLPFQTKASKKKSMRQQLSAGVLAEQSTNIMTSEPAPTTSQPWVLTTAPKENQPIRPTTQSAPLRGLSQLFSVRKPTQA